MNETLTIALSIVVAGFVIFLGTVAFIGAVVVLGLGAWGWSNAIAGAHRARAHGVAAEIQEQTAIEATDAIEEARERAAFTRDYDPPTDDELRDYVRADRNGQRGEREYDTLGNEGVDPEGDALARTGMYVPPSPQ